MSGQDIDVPERIAFLETADSSASLADFGTGERWRANVGAAAMAPWRLGEARSEPLHDPVSDALTLVRLTGNAARAHRDKAEIAGSIRPEPLIDSASGRLDL